MRHNREENCKVKVVSVHVTKEYGAIEVQPPSFFASALDGDDWSVSRPGRFTLGKAPRYPLSRSRL